MSIVVPCSGVYYIVDMASNWIHRYGTTLSALYKGLLCDSLNRKQVLRVRLLFKKLFKSFLSTCFHELIRPNLLLTKVINSTQRKSADMAQFAQSIIVLLARFSLQLDETCWLKLEHLIVDYKHSYFEVKSNLFAFGHLLVMICARDYGNEMA